jgi:hypothetical protein
VIYVGLQEDNPKQPYVTIDSGSVVVRLSLEEAENIATSILQLLGRRESASSSEFCPNVVSIAEFMERMQASTHSPEGGSSVG